MYLHQPDGKENITAGHLQEEEQYKSQAEKALHKGKILKMQLVKMPIYPKHLAEVYGKKHKGIV
jgi:hypothetical protein